MEHKVSSGVYVLPLHSVRAGMYDLFSHIKGTDTSQASTFTVANLYYNQPILNKIAATFDITYEQSSQTATLLQAGYAAGLVLILPMGDMVERRLFIIALVFFTATLVRLPLETSS